MNSAMGRLLVLGALLAAPVALADDSKQTAPASEPSTTAPAATASGRTTPAAEQPGRAAPLMVVTVDPETGKLRPATAEERAALEKAGGARVLGLTGRETYVERRPDGSKVARLGPEYFRWLVTRVGYNGKVSVDCAPAGNANAPPPAPVAPEK